MASDGDKNHCGNNVSELWFIVSEYVYCSKVSEYLKYYAAVNKLHRF